MELMVEPKLEIVKVAGQWSFFQHKPSITPEPVLVGDNSVDSGGALIYGSVLNDGGKYRMWYQATPKGPRKYPSCLVGYAESDDGIEWYKPNLGMVDYNGKRNNLCNLGVHCPSVFIDPDSPPNYRYRATGHIDSRWGPYHADAEPYTGFGYYTAHSHDGLNWELDSPSPRWRYADCIYSTYHPGRGGAQVLMKVVRRIGGLARRTWWEVEMQDGRWSNPSPALIPDDFADVSAIARGYASADYYGIGLLPVGCGTVGFVQQFRHNLPRRTTPMGSEAGRLGVVDLSLAYQADRMSGWAHAPGRSDFVAHGDIPWATRLVYCASSVTEFGNEHRLYIGCTPGSHGVSPPKGMERSETIGYASWPEWRLFGYRADQYGELDIDLGVLTKSSEFVLNYEVQVGGSIQVQISILNNNQRIELHNPVAIEGRSANDGLRLIGNNTKEVVRWSNGSVIHPSKGHRAIAHLSVERATIYGYELRTIKT